LRYPGLDVPWPGGDEDLPDLGDDGIPDDDEDEDVDYLSSEHFRQRLEMEIEHQSSGASKMNFFLWW